MIVPNEVLEFWFRILLNAYLNSDWELVQHVVLDLEKVYKKLQHISSKKQLQQERKGGKMNKYMKMARKERYKKLEEEK